MARARGRRFLRWVVIFVVFGSFSANIFFISILLSKSSPSEEQSSLGHNVPSFDSRATRKDHAIQTKPIATFDHEATSFDNPATRKDSATHVDSLAKKTKSHSLQKEEIPESKIRFPLYGSREFNASCGWTMETRHDAKLPTNCTLLARPGGDGGEGISAWIGTIVTGFVMSKQTGCSFKIDYAAGVNISDIWIPVSASVADWRVPSGYECLESDNCLVVWSAYPRGGGSQFRNLTKAALAAVPFYRNPYGSETNFVKMHKYADLKSTMGPSFKLQTSMQCTFGSLIRLSPSAIKFQPNLYSTILPTLRDPNAFVISVYIRTGHTENIQIAEQTEKYRNRSIPILDCAMSVEKSMKKDHQHVVWMLVTDSPYLKTWITGLYSNGTTSSSSSRTIVTTQSRGAHTKTRGQLPSTADFAEGILDWYLIGESDAVVADHYAPSFGNTAAFRGVGPYFKVPKESREACSVVEPVYSWSSSPEEQSSLGHKVPSLDSRATGMDQVIQSKRLTTLSHKATSFDSPATRKDPATHVDSLAEKMKSRSIQKEETPKSKIRFPLFGTREFNSPCGWTMETRHDAKLPTNCTLLARPLGNGGEGISAWIGTIVTGFVMSKQTGCSFKIDYAAGVNISDIWIPVSASVADWRVPSGYECLESDNCLVVWSAYPRGGGSQFRNLTKAALAAVPSYRSPYGSETDFLRMHKYAGLKSTMGPSFKLQTSMQCTFGSLIRLSPSAIKFQPNLYTTILPTLRDPNAFVISVYIRTGHTENIQIAEQTEKYRNRSIPILDCAMSVEKSMKKEHQHVVWMLVTDSPYLKTWITGLYSNGTTSSSSSRTIVTTQSRGAHTKTRGQLPSTADFAEGILDWYLIGESDAVVADHYAPSFGNTAAFRGVGPYFKVPKESREACSVVEPVYSWSSSPEEQSSLGHKVPSLDSRATGMDQVIQSKRLTTLSHKATSFDSPATRKDPATHVDSLAEKMKSRSIQKEETPKSKIRFPLFGTREFNSPCGWTMETRHDAKLPTNCTLLARPLGNGGEGISAWIGTIVTGFVMSKQTGCSFKIDYAAGVNISDIWIPVSASVADWRVPSGYECLESDNCLVVWSAYPRGGGSQFRNLTKASLAAVPSYRSPYGSETDFLRMHKYAGLKSTMGPSFKLQTSMQCTFGSLIRLSPSAIKFQPNLYTTILPTLRDPSAFVISVYIRTGHTENIQIAEQTEKYRNRSIPILDCAMSVEKSMKKEHQHVVWMLVTDSPYLKTWITGLYSNGTTSSSSPRTIVTTQSRGAHTKTRGQLPSTADFAEGILDWYLIGESDAVVADQYAPSFGNTAAFRGVGPYFKVPKESREVCSVVEPAYKWSSNH